MDPAPADDHALSAAPRALDSLTSLRFVAAAAVFFLHVGIVLGAELPHVRAYGRVVFFGPCGVGFFFVLSGFVLTYSRRRQDTAHGFYQRRIARIYPNQLIALAGAILLLFWLGQSFSIGPAAANLFLVQAWVPSLRYFGALDTPSWSLSVELFFYLLFPVLIVGVSALASTHRRVLMAVCVAIPLAIALSQSVWGPHMQAGAENYFVMDFPISRLADFTMGVLLALEIRDGRWPRLPVAWTMLLMAAGLAVVDVIQEQRFLVAITLVPATLLIGSLAMADMSGRRSILQSNFAVRLGQWSFAFYLVHWLVLTVFWKLHQHPFASTLNAAAAIIFLFLLTTAISGLVFTLWERPWERRIRPGHTTALELRKV
jgi:peptidoglycan/LPS O-acetylase OafA/YrhL